VVALLGVALVCLITTLPLLIAVAAAVCSRDTQRRADARLIVQLLRRHPETGGRACGTAPSIRMPNDSDAKGPGGVTGIRQLRVKTGSGQSSIRARGNRVVRQPQLLVDSHCVRPVVASQSAGVAVDSRPSHRSLGHRLIAR
jgi:hypothetical protein